MTNGLVWRLAATDNKFHLCRGRAALCSGIWPVGGPVERPEHARRCVDCVAIKEKSE